MRFKNREGHEAWNIPTDHVARRKVGLSAMLRLKDEETWIGPCIESILPWFDEVVCVLLASGKALERGKDVIGNLSS